MPKRRIAAFLAMVILVIAGPVLADENSELQNVQRQMQEQQSKINGAQEKADSIIGQLQKIQIALEEASKEHKAIQSQLGETEQRIKTNETALKAAEKSLAERQQILNKRVRDIYKNGQISYIDVLFGASDFADFTTRMDILERIMKQDADLIIQVKTERDTVQHKKAELEREYAAQLALKQAAEEKKKVIEDKKKEQEHFLNEVVSERDAAQRAYQELVDTSRQIEERLRTFQGSQSSSASSGASSGAMLWPVYAPISSPFGWRTHPIFGTKIYHSGLDLAADYGETVKAADGGVVVHAGWYGGYGKAVIISHGGGISTLYGHNSELIVSEGQSVAKGQAISYVGSTGYSTGPHLHFEVRVDGTPVNPLNYLP